MTARSRTADDRATHTGSSYYYLSGTSTRNANDGQYRSCDDHIGNYPNVNPFESHSKWTVKARLSGSQYSTLTPGMLLRQLTNYPVDRDAVARDPRTEFGILLPGDIGQRLKETVTKGSPAATHVSLPTALGELKDFGPGILKIAPKIYQTLRARSFQSSLRAIPELVRQFGNTLIGWAANGYISWRWIIKPMLSDLRKLIQFKDAVEKRRLTLQRLIEGKSSRRRVMLDTSTVVRPQTRVFFHTSSGFTLQADWKITYTKKTWGTARWKATEPNALPPEDRGHKTRLREKAWNLTFGVTSFALLQTAWELTPWSWFADWFNGIGDTIATYNNEFPCYWQDACIMRTLTSKAEYTLVPGQLPTWAALVQPAVEEWTIKQRFNDSAAWLPVLPTSFPLLDSGKWSILSALAASSVDRGLPALHRRWGR